jgi:hypothetical protein
VKPFTPELLRKLAHRFGTPLWVYDAAAIRGRISEQRAFDTMHVRRTFCFAVLMLGGMLAPAMQDSQGILQAALQANGLKDITTIYYYGTGTSYDASTSRIAGQLGRRTDAWEYAAAMNFSTEAIAITGTAFEQWGEPEPRLLGGMTGHPGSLWGPSVAAWATPWGFLMGADKFGATVERRRARGRTYHVVSWQLPHRSPSGIPFQVTAFLNDALQVERVEGWTTDPLFGDVAVEAQFSDYRDSGGVKYPARIVQTRRGMPYQELLLQGASVDPVQARNKVLRTIPLIASPPPLVSAPLDGTEKIADGVYQIRGYPNSLVVEFADHVLMFEPGAGNEARTLAGIAETRRLFPGKPIRYGVISSHHALRSIGAVAAEGITIVTTRVNAAYLREVLDSPRTLAPDALTRSGRRPLIEGFRGTSRVFKDATRTVEIHVLQGMPHIEGMVVAWLPKEKILAYSEGFYVRPSMVPVQSNLPNRRRAFVQNVERLGLDPELLVTGSAKAFRMTLADMREELARD